MKIVTLFVGALLLVGSLGTGTAFGAAPGVISNQVITEGSYCHLTSPAIREETLSWDRPVLKDPSSGDIIDFSDRAIRTHLGKTKSTSRDWNASIAGGGVTMTETTVFKESRVARRKEVSNGRYKPDGNEMSRYEGD